MFKLEKCTRQNVVGCLLMLCGIASVVFGIMRLRSIEAESRNLSGDYIYRYLQGENLAEQKIPYYIVICFGAAVFIVGLILRIIKTHEKVSITNSYYNNIPRNNIMNQMLKCPVCNSLINANDTVCASCGCNLKQLHQTGINQYKNCPNCNKLNKIGSSFCSACGFKLK